tara:strand:+ start:1911 stop:3548 length:1638 start_codon:yes stop_codon:yes gene_type:complete
MAYKKSKSVICPFCDFSSKHEKRVDQHLQSVHGTSLEAEFVRIKLGNVPHECKCGCGESTKFNGWKKGYTKFKKGHNARVDSAFSHPAVIEKCIRTRAEGFARGEFTTWNAGLTKETSSKVASMSRKIGSSLKRYYDNPDNESWQSGLTKDTDERLRKMSETKKRMYRLGQIASWNTGLTKETDSRLKSAAIKISKKYQERQAGNRLSPEVIKERAEKANFTILKDTYQDRRLSKLLVRCNVCNIEQHKTLYSLEGVFACLHCKPLESKGQIEIFEFITSLGVTAVMSDRTIIKPKELDIVIPNKKLAIEFNGLFWHSEKYMNKSYHAQKTQTCKMAGYQLLHVFDDEWRKKQDIIKSMIRYKLGLCQRRIGARKCRIKNVNVSDRRQFFNENHIDGDTPSTCAIGLYLGNELLACLSLRRPFHKKWKDRLEIARFAQKRDTTVAGSLSRLTKVALQKTGKERKKGLISYVDTRYGNGQGYISAGFQKESETKGSFWWTDNYSRFNRFKFRADKLRGLTEKEVALEAGVMKIYGCPQIVMTIDAK